MESKKSQPVEYQKSVFQILAEEINSDLFIYSGEMNRQLVTDFINQATAAKSKPNVALLLSTFGGDAHAAYILAKFLKRNYQSFQLYIFGFCKSAGTIIALSADEIVMSEFGELGPLDVQLPKQDELLVRSSGLELSQAMSSLSDLAFEIFEKHFLEIIQRGGGAITTHTAAEIASKLSVGLIAPVTDQIDPLRVGEFERKMSISYQYGIRLNRDRNLVRHLVRNYPDHSFVIDFDEAEKLFGNVRLPNDNENNVAIELIEYEGKTGNSLVTFPNEKGLVGNLIKGQEENSNEQTEADSQIIDEQSIAEESKFRSEGSSKQANGNNERNNGEGRRENLSQSKKPAS